MVEENKIILNDEEESKAKKFWKNVGIGALSLVLAALTIVVVCM